MKNVAIIGLGQLGSRHLQALANVKQAINIELVDVSSSALDMAIQRFKEMPGSDKFKGSIKCLLIPEALSPELDIVIVACNSKERSGITNFLLANKKVKYLILEKVLFPCLVDYDIVKRLLKSTNTKAWVNCSRRMMPSYEVIKNYLQSKSPLLFHVSGSNWGMGSNGIHFLDLFSYLSNDYSLQLSNTLLDKTNPIESKRKGYHEFTGTISGHSQVGNHFSMTSFKTGSLPIQLIIETETERIVINEYKNEAVIFSEKNAWQPIKEDFIILFQSQLTTMLVEQLILKDSCGLPTFEESLLNHKILLNTFIAFQKSIGIMSEDCCYIT